MKKIKFRNLKQGECFRLTKNGPIYMDDGLDAQRISGKQPGYVNYSIARNRKVYPVKIKISEVK